LQTIQNRGLQKEAQQRLNEFMSTLRNMQVGMPALPRSLAFLV
jgi:hypothetical protein